MTRSRKLLGSIVAAFAATIALLPAADSVAAEPRRHVVEIRKFTFAPRTLAVRPGDVVVWENADIVPHTATAEDRSWDSGTIAPGGTWETTVNDAMLGDYFCRFHPSMVASFRPASE